MRSIKIYYSILSKKGLYTCLREAKKALWPLWFTHNRTAIEYVQSSRVSRVLNRKYGKIIQKPLDARLDAEQSRIIWVCWLQGLENAPEIVQRCVASIHQWAKGYEVRIITLDNILDYISLPDYILKKYKSGIIYSAQFSDIVRTALLVQYGGIWLDATVMLTGEIPVYIRDADLFFFQKSVLNSIPHVGSNWFLAAKKGHPIMKRMLELLYAYWKTHNILRDYYIYHLFLYLLTTKNAQGKEYLKQMPYIPNVDVHTLQFRLFDEYRQEEWDLLTQRASVHKLTWKFNHNEPLDKKGTYYDYILHHLHL